MATYKFKYFPLEGRGELSRFIFAQAGVEYEDIRVPWADWPEVKPTTPWGCLPTLEVEGQTIAGSLGIARFLAERFGLGGTNDVENAKMFGLVDYTEDTFKQILKTLFEKDDTAKAELQKNLQEKVVPEAFTRFEKQLKDNSTGWLYGTKVSYADFAVYNIVAMVTAKDATILDNFPLLAKLKASVEGLENIKQWIKKRPAQVFPPGV